MAICAANYWLDASENCTATAGCDTDIKDYALDQFSGNKSITVFGVAKDGHIIIGPYDSAGNVFDCSKLDSCGGTWLSDGSYAYVMQKYFPYHLNCFGPAMTYTYNASCTSNNCVPGYTTSSNAKMMMTTLFGMMILLISALF